MGRSTVCVCVHILKTHLFKVACRVEWAEKEWENTKIKHKSVSQLMGLAALQCGLITYRLIFLQSLWDFLLNVLLKLYKRTYSMRIFHLEYSVKCSPKKAQTIISRRHQTFFKKSNNKSERASLTIAFTFFGDGCQCQCIKNYPKSHKYYVANTYLVNITNFKIQ